MTIIKSVERIQLSPFTGKLIIKSTITDIDDVFVAALRDHRETITDFMGWIDHENIDMLDMWWGLTKHFLNVVQEVSVKNMEDHLIIEIV